VWAGRWWFAVIPAIASSLQATIFVTASAVIGRARPDAAHLDPVPPTSNYPSGHVDASVALNSSLTIMATTMKRPWLRLTGRRLLDPPARRHNRGTD
jgi:undecaprenyl-diphosphatase